MNYTEFTETLSKANPPDGLGDLLLALWYDARGDWDKAHNIVQDIHSRDASWMHAYLHRKEGDQGNAEYWYHRAGRTTPTMSLEEEWEEMVKEMLDNLNT